MNRGRYASLDGKTYEHGVRARYVRGCRCAPCRAANTQYARDREAWRERQLAEIWAENKRAGRPTAHLEPCPGVGGVPCARGARLTKASRTGLCIGCRQRATFEGLVPAERARAHLMELSAAGIGRRAVAAACDVAETSLENIRNGTSAKIKAETERRILAVDQGARADHATVPAGPTNRAIRELVKLGWTRGRIAEALGSTAKTPALQLGTERVLARSAAAVELLLQRARREASLSESDRLIRVLFPTLQARARAGFTSPAEIDRTA